MKLEEKTKIMIIMIIGRCCLIPFIGILFVYLFKAFFKIKKEYNDKTKNSLNSLLDFNLDISLTFGVIILILLQFVYGIF